MKRKFICIYICIAMLLTSCGVKNGDAFKASPQSLSTDKELGQETAPAEKKESESFFLGQKEASEVMGIIQNRVELYLQE